LSCCNGYLLPADVCIQVHPDVKKFTLADKKVPATLEELEHQVISPPVVATTCLSIDQYVFFFFFFFFPITTPLTPCRASPLFSQRSFDYCIVDEASQITLPTCIGPLRFAEKFVLVGDHFQLPPLVCHIVRLDEHTETDIL